MRYINNILSFIKKLIVSNRHDASVKEAYIMLRECTASETIWNPRTIFDFSNDQEFAVVVLNQPISLHHEHVLPMWEKAKVTITVDGGTNRWMDYLGDKALTVLSGQCKKYLPTLLTGDMDSIRPKLLEQLKCAETSVIHTPDKLETDFTKALIELSRYTSMRDIQLDGIYVFAETAGRLDQIVSNVNTLYKASSITSNVPVIQISSDSLTWLLKPGNHKLVIPDILITNKNWCALIPFGTSDDCITTTGLKWNLNKSCLKFGELLSTSNTYDGRPEVTITTDVSVIWTMGIEKLVKLKE